MDHVRQCSQPNLAHDRQGDLTDHLSRMTGDDRCPENLIRPFPDVDLDKTFFLSIGDGTVDVIQWSDEGVHSDSLFLGISLIHPDMGDLRIRVSTPGNRQGTLFLAAQETRHSG